ncbi:MAG: hypothetical protein ABJG78_01195 [Cyclobacteriaceae bacterium]
MKRFEADFLKFRHILLFTLIACLLPAVGFAQKRNPGKAVYKYNQYVMVTLKDGTEVPARVSSVKSKTQCYVRMIGGDKTGMVSKKFMRPMTADEITEVRKKQENVTRNDKEAQKNSRYRLERKF